MSAEAGDGKGATGTYPGKGNRRVTPFTRYAVPAAAALLVLFGIAVYAVHLRKFVPSGVPATIVLGVCIYFAWKYLREYPAAAVDRATIAGRGTGTE